MTRTMNLGSPTDAGTPIFDEKHYAPQAWQMLHNRGVEDNPGYGLVVHPPVGKQLIAIGEAMFGYNGLGWRFTGAVLGTIMVALVVRIARRISRSTLVGAIAGLLVIADGVSFVVARTALLDGFLAFLVLAAFGALIVDRDQVRERMHVAHVEGRIDDTAWGPRLGVRWWRFGAGLLLGLACGTKWSGLYFVAFFAVMSLAFDIAARRQYRVPRPWLGTVRRDLFPTAYALLVIPLGVYLASYAPWFASETAIDRHEVGQSIGTKSNFPLPDAIRSLWHYTYNAYHFHAGLTNAAGNYHPWESKPWAWPMSLRPVLYAIDQQNVPGCGAQSCVKAVMWLAHRRCGGFRCRCCFAPAGGCWFDATGATPRFLSAIARAGCRGSPISIVRCTSSTRQPWRRSWRWLSRCFSATFCTSRGRGQNAAASGSSWCPVTSQWF